MKESIRISVDDVTVRCTMHNLSPSGCMVECPELLPDIGGSVEVTLLPSYVVQGQIAWQVGENIGIFFIEPIHEAVVRHYALDSWELRGDWSAGGIRNRGSEKNRGFEPYPVAHPVSRSRT